MDRWETIRLRCVRDGEPIKTVARELGLSKNTVRKYVHSLRAPQHPGLERACRLDAYVYHIDNLIRRLCAVIETGPPCGNRNAPTRGGWFRLPDSNDLWIVRSSEVVC